MIRGQSNNSPNEEIATNTRTTTLTGGENEDKNIVTSI